MVSGGRAEGGGTGGLLRLYAAFALTGVVTTLIGPFLAEAARLWRLGGSTAGLFFPAQFAAAMAGTLAIGKAAAKFGHARVFALSVLMMAAGVGLSPWGPVPLALAAVAVYGAGIGLNVPAANAMAARAGGASVETALTRLNLAWGAGAVLGPAVLSYSLSRWSFTGALLALAAVLAAAAALQWRGAGNGGGGADSPAKAEIRASGARRAAWSAAALLFLYVGTENAFSGWLPLVASQAHRATPEGGGAAVSMFWASLLGGRGVAVLALRRVTPAHCLQAGLAVFLAGAVTAATSHSLHLFWAGAAVAGFGLGPVFPLLVAAYYRKAGVVMDVSGSAVAGMAVPLISGGLLALLNWKRG